jgi:outer membrane protein OmpA-like peptidoglycan-associated protein
MRKLVHNTTALAACLSMIAPQVALAQGWPSAPSAPITAAGDPVLLAQSVKDLQGIDEDVRKQLMKAERKKKEEAAKAKAEKTKSHDKGKADKTKDSGKKQAQQQADGQGNKHADRPDRDQKAKPAKQHSGNGKHDERKASSEGKGKKPKEDRRDKASAGTKKDAQVEAARKAKQRKEQAQRQEDKAREKAREAERARDRDDRRKAAAANSRVGRAGSQSAKQRAGEMAGLSKVLDQELASGLTEDRLSCVSGGSFPCARGTRVMTPRGVVLERDGDGYRLAPKNAQTYRADGDGKMVARGSNDSDRRGNQAAKEAARETRAALAQALDDRQTRRDIRKQRITRENRRSSSQDFSTSLRDVLAQTSGQAPHDRARNDDDNDDNDLVKALLLGAGALAVGSMLNNNRQVALSSPDRVVFTRPDGSHEVVKDETVLLRQPGSNVTTENFDDGSSRTIVTRPDGSKVVTIRDADLRILRRTLISADGRSTRLIDDTETVPPVDIASLPRPVPAPASRNDADMDQAALREALRRETSIDRRFTLGQVRNIPEVRSLVAPLDLDAITFDTGSAALRPDQAAQLSSLGSAISTAVAENPREIFMIEGYTDTVGPDVVNLALSDRRAESVALALTEYFDVPPENLVVQGYGEQFLKVRAEGHVRDNRRVAVRRVTDLLRVADSR